MRKIFIGLVGLLICQFGYGQSSLYSSKQKKTYWDGESSYQKGDFLSAINTLKELEGVDPHYYELDHMIGDSYFAMEKYEEAIPYLRKGAEVSVDANYQLAFMHLYLTQLDSAAHYMQRFIAEKEVRGTKLQDFEIKQMSDNIRNARMYIDNGEIVNIINLGKGVNTAYNEYVPLISSDEELLIFTSRRNRENEPLDPFNQPYEDVYYSRNETDGNLWQTAKLIEGEVNTKGHDACVGLSPDGNTMFIFRTNKNLIAGDLYESLYLEGKWTTPIRLSNNINNYESIEPSASISLDGRTLYFSSNRAGGFGGFDIYRVVKLPNGEWSLPLNLGDSINTPFDEDAPFIHPDGKTLYFSSKGHSNMGGYDIFKAEVKEDAWSSPTNLGYPTNSTKDDIYFTISANEQHGYYSSDKEGGFGGQDIYLIDYLEKELRQSVISTVVSLNDRPVNADISLIDMESGDLIGSYISNPKNGKFIFLVNPDVEYELIIEGDDFEEYSEIINYSVEDLLKKQKKIIELSAN